MVDRKHIAVLSTLYYPDMGAPSACIDKYVKELRDDYCFHIITRTDCVDFEPSAEYDVRYISSFRHRLILRCRKNMSDGRNTLISKLMLGLIDACKLFQTQYSFPSAQRWEVIQYARQLDLLNKEVGVDVVIAVSNTAFTQLAALRYKKKHPSVKWISVFYDPYSENYIYYKYKLIKPFWKWLNRRKEQEIYRYTDYCLMTTDLYRYIPVHFEINRQSLFQLQFPLNKINANGLYDTQLKSDDKTCRLIYAGMFYKVIRNPEFALSTLSKVKNIRFDMFVGTGECEDIINRYKQKNICREQFVKHDRYLEMICNEYDVLVNVGNVSTLQSPSKTLELLSSGKPILNFYFSKDSQYEMIEKYPLGLNVGYQEVGAVKKIEQFCHEMKGRSISFEEVERLFPENSLGKQVDLLRNLIES